MPTLLLMRHAEAGLALPGGGDHERPLTPAGVEDAAAAGRMLARRQLGPDLALVSTARRAQETFAALRGAMARDIDMRPDRGLYGAEPDTILATVRADAADAATVLVIGHNPGIGALALTLAGDARSPGLRSFGAATLAVFDFAASDWSPGGATLRCVLTSADFRQRP